MGNIQEFWDVIYADSSIVGVAIWDWVDQEFAKKDKGIEYRAYGGDFGDQPYYYAFFISLCRPR